MDIAFLELLHSKVYFDRAFHDHVPGGGPDGAKWITIQYFDDDGNILYHKKKDGTEWDRLHVFKDKALNETESEVPVEIYTK